MYSNFKAKKMLKVKSKRKSMRYKMLYLSQIKISTLKQKKIIIIIIAIAIYILFILHMRKQNSIGQFEKEKKNKRIPALSARKFLN